MSINRSRSQIYFEKMFTSNGGKPFSNVNKHDYENRVISKEETENFRDFLEDEILSYYYKALLSYIEAIPALEQKHFSWATVRLYYSVFYSIKAFLACNNIAILRAERMLFYIKLKPGEKFKKCKESTDHKGTILTFCEEFKDKDILLSNNLDSDEDDPMNVYMWMMKRREEVNYKDIDFHDPDAPDFWVTLDKEIEDNGIRETVDKLVNDNWLYCFQSEYAILAVPTKRLILTVDEMQKTGKKIYVPTEKKEFIDGMSGILSENSIEEFEIWRRV